MTLNTKNWYWIGLAVLLLAAYALRIHRLDTVALRGDEAYTAVHGTTTPFTEPWQEVIETQPNPGMLTAYWFWSELTGLSEFALRYINLLTNVAGLAVMLALTHRMQRSWRLAVLVGVLWLVNPFFLWHSQDARHYAFTTLLTPLSLYLFLRALDRNEQRDWRYYIIVQAIALYVNILDGFWLVVQSIYLLSLRRWDLLRRAIVAWIVMGVLLIPLAYQTYIVRVKNAYGGAANPAEFRMLFEDFPATLLFGENTWPGWIGGLVLFVLIGGAAIFARRRALLLGWIIIPLALLYLSSLNTSIFEPRYIINLAPALLLAIVVTADGFGEWIGRWIRRTSRWMSLQDDHTVVGTRHGVSAGYRMVIALAFIIVVFSAIEINDYFYHDPPKAADWRGLVAYLDERVTAQDVIISDSIDPALEYYYQGAAEVLFIPADDPEPQGYMDRVITEHRGIYVLAGERTGPVTRYLQDHAQPIPGDNWPGISQFREWEVDPAEIQTTLNLKLGDVAILRGVTLIDDTSLLLYWEAVSQTEVDHSVLVHIEHAPDAPPDAVLDHGIAAAVVSTRTWEPGTVYRDPVALPTLPPGTYTVRVGLYPTGTQDRLLAVDREDEDGRYAIAEVTVK